MGFLDDVNARRASDRSAEESLDAARRAAEAASQPRVWAAFRELAELCRSRGVASLTLYEQTAGEPKAHATPGWLYEYNGAMHIAFDELGYVWSTAGYANIKVGRILPSYKQVPLIGSAIVDEHHLMVTGGPSISDCAIAAGAQVLAGRAEGGVIPLDPVTRERNERAAYDR